jgi:hypothetical protein
MKVTSPLQTMFSGEILFGDIGLKTMLYQNSSFNDIF